jgi:hypothetical protein
MQGSLLNAYLADAEDDLVTLAPLPGTTGHAGADSEHANSGACCPSGSCCASGSCCQSGSACVTADEDAGARRGRRTAAASHEKRLWPVPV